MAIPLTQLSPDVRHAAKGRMVAGVITGLSWREASISPSWNLLLQLPAVAPTLPRSQPTLFKSALALIKI